MYINQRDIAGWEKQGCGIACVAMVLLRAGRDVQTEDLVREALAADGYLDGIGWKHAILTRILTNRNIPAYTQDFTSPGDDTTLFRLGEKKVREQAAAGSPVIVSVLRGFQPSAASTHLVLITGVTENSFVIDDPDHTGGAEGMNIPFDTFSKAWRGYAIFTEIPRA